MMILCWIFYVFGSNLIAAMHLEDTDDNDVVLYVMLRAVDRFFLEFSRYPGYDIDTVESDIPKLKVWWMLLISHCAEGPVWQILKCPHLSVCLSYISLCHCNSKTHCCISSKLQLCAPCHRGVLYIFFYIDEMLLVKNWYSYAILSYLPVIVTNFHYYVYLWQFWNYITQIEIWLNYGIYTQIRVNMMQSGLIW